MSIARAPHHSLLRGPLMGLNYGIPCAVRRHTRPSLPPPPRRCSFSRQHLSKRTRSILRKISKNLKLRLFELSNYAPRCRRRRLQLERRSRRKMCTNTTERAPKTSGLSRRVLFTAAARAHSADPAPQVPANTSADQLQQPRRKTSCSSRAD